MKLLKIVIVNVFLSCLPFAAVWGNTENNDVPSKNVHNIVIDKRRNDVTNVPNDNQQSNSQSNQIKIDKIGIDGNVKNTTRK